MNHSGDAANGAETRSERVSAGQPAADDIPERLAALLATSPHNLVARAERADVRHRHVAECEALATVLTPTGRWLDLGTGGGLPGLVLAARHPTVEWVLVDATAKKVAAVRYFAAELRLSNVTVVHARAETLAHEPAFRGRCDGVVTRAVAPMPTLVELCRGFVRAGGDVVAVKGPAWERELAAATPALQRLGLKVVSTARLPGTVRETWVVTMRASGGPPPGYPRRDGLPKAVPIT